MKLKFYFRKPERFPAVLLYPHRETLFKKYVFKEIKYRIIDPGSFNLDIYLNFSIILKTLKLILQELPRFNIQIIMQPREIASKIYKIHLQAVILILSPSIVLTFIDDSSIFHYLANKFRHIDFLSLQNGMRPQCYFDYQKPIVLDNVNKKNLPYSLCFGDSDIELFRTNKVDVKNYTSIGSFVGGIYWSEIRKEQKIEFDICYISQFVSRYTNSVKDISAKILYEADILAAERLEKNLKKLIDEKKYSLVIALRKEDCEEEINYYQSIFGDKIAFQEQSQDSFSSYQAINKSNLVISIYSTIAAEAMGMNKKVLFCNGSNNASIGLPAAGICYYEGHVYNEFKKKVDDILFMSDAEYNSLMANNIKYLMNYNDKNLPHTIVRNKILKSINNNKFST